MKKNFFFLFGTFLIANLLVINSCNKDECAKLTWYEDHDSDGFGNSEVFIQRCEQPEGYVVDSTDFNDSSAYAYPGAVELCTDSIDNDNNGFIDCEDFDCDCDESKNCYDGIDNDNDGFIDCDDWDCDCDESKNCSDGIDNDNDGFIDCDDLDCDCK